MSEFSDGNSQIVVQRLLDRLRAGEELAASELMNTSMDRYDNFLEKFWPTYPASNDGKIRMMCCKMLR